MRRNLAAIVLAGILVAGVLVSGGRGSAAPTSPTIQLSPVTVGQAVVVDTTPPLREMTPITPTLGATPEVGERSDRAAIELGGSDARGTLAHKSDGALQEDDPPAASLMPAPSLTFEGPSNEDNFRIFGGRVNPPDPVGDVGRRHSWSPNGKLIAFARGSDSESTIVVSAPDGTGERVVVRSTMYGAFDPAWRPPAVLPDTPRQPCPWLTRSLKSPPDAGLNKRVPLRHR